MRANPQADDLPTESILSPSQLTFGGLCGICAGVFVKKGAKLVAFTLGAAYVLMQVSRRVIPLPPFSRDLKDMTTSRMTDS